MEGLVTAPAGALDDAFWRPVRTLFDEIWPGMPSQLDRAASFDARWEEVSTPFAWFEGGRAVAHVGIIRHDLLLDGTPVSVAGFHAVCTTPSHRGRGLALRLLEEAVRWSGDRFATAKLHTDIPALYARVGFREVPLHRFRTDAAGGGGRARPLDPDVPADRRRLLDALAARVPCSRRLCTRDPGWLPLIDACLAGAERRLFHAVDGAPWIAAWEVRDGVLSVLDVFGPSLPDRDELLASVAEPFRSVRWCLTPDLLDPSARAELVPAAEGAFQVLGPWDPVGPVAIPMPWEH
jgi:GNAT superfamily N-acetyltransferase